MKNGSRNILRDEDVSRIVEIWWKRAEEDRFSCRASLNDIRDIGFNLNIPRYVDTFEPEPEVDLRALARASRNLAPLAARIKDRLRKHCTELGFNESWK